MKQTRKNEHGNALWFILLAVALMAALTAVISRSTDTAEQSGNIERFRVQASAIMRYTSNIREAVNTMRLRGIGEGQIDFTSAGFGGVTCPDCLLYGSAGGGAGYQSPMPDWLDSDHSSDATYGQWEFTGNSRVTDIGSANPELIMFLGYLKFGLCAQINAMLDVPGGIPEDTDNFDVTAFAGTFDDASPETIDNMDGMEAGCFLDTGTREYTFYQVLVKR